MNDEKPNEKIRAWIENYKEIILTAVFGVLIILSVVAMWREQEVATIAYVLAGWLTFVLLYPGPITSLRFGGYEIRMREVQDTMAEARDLAKLIAEIAIPLAHHSEGWAGTAPSTVQMKDAVIGRAMKLKDRFGIEISADVLELHYVKTCGDYQSHITVSLDSDDEKAFHKELSTPMIPSKIEDVPTPETIENILRKLELWDDYMEKLIEDYRYYYKNREHRNQSRWNGRVEWKRPAAKNE